MGNVLLVPKLRVIVDGLVHRPQGIGNAIDVGADIAEISRLWLVDIARDEDPIIILVHYGSEHSSVVSGEGLLDGQMS